MQESYVLVAAFGAIAALWGWNMYQQKRQDERYARQDERYDQLLDLLIDSLNVNDSALKVAETQIARPRFSGRSSVEAVVRGRRAIRKPPRGSG